MAMGDIGHRVVGGVFGCPFSIPFILCQACPTPCRFLSVLPWLFSGMVASGFIAGNIFCGMVCPFGILSGALYKAPVKGLRISDTDSRLRYLGYGVLALLLYISYEGVKILMGYPITGFWSIAVAYGREAAILLAAATIITLATSIFIYRPWCRFICPLGTILRTFNRFSLLSLRVEPERCKACSCTMSCPQGFNTPPASGDCIRCLSCYFTCRGGGIQLALSHRAR